MALTHDIHAPVVLALSASGAPIAHRVAAILGAQVHGREGRVAQADAYFANALDHARDLFAAGTPIVGICASGILIRGVAPLLADKTTEPPVISVSDDGRVVVPLLGGHRGANRLASQIAEGLDGTAAVTTAGDVAMGVALDEPPAGWRVVNPEGAKAVMAGLLNGERFTLTGAAPWLAGVAAMKNVSVDAAPHLPTKGSLPVDLKADDGDASIGFVRQDITLGLGCARGADVEEVWTLVQDALGRALILAESIACVASLDLKADEGAMNEIARRLDVPYRVFTATELEAEADRLQTPSDVVFAEVGCHGVSEGAALAAAGPDSALIIPKAKTANATCAVARASAPISKMRGRARGRLSVVGIGPGQASWRTPEVSKLVADAEELVGYGLYIDLLGPLAAGKARSDFPLGGEEARCRYALEQAAKGKNVALVCSGDAGIYAMGALVFELLDRGPDEEGVSDAARRVEVVCSPGVSALQGAAARAGAPLGHDFCTISLSDLLTPRDDIIRRLHAAAEGDFVIAFYNPVSKTRRTLLAEARDILLQHRPVDTPVMLATNLGRPTEHVRYRALKDLQVDEVDMLTVVLVGSSNSRLARLGEGPRMFTPRGYARKIDGDLTDKRNDPYIPEEATP
ncbi:precorrin-3B C(17)-methyltransferase [Pseudooctadecabacter jejudonensis]|uniref:Precorrin-3B C(17)-methyltransferase n=1 Tax=Pseudooctadecabacter jejudonensis TaxID=1391910 RepID=A0A1Y5S0T4_9RHOB|nr:precorrin-3B C(17)-methyltransferase [Pseudooctadecabacter jejudonensis]SLN29488.1 Precorrin-3B C(17)-methyltransferase [Pseudooctadecabacter jejudonensis]